MARSINKIILVGNVGRDPDVQVTSTGTKVAHLSLATSRTISKDGAVVQRTEWHWVTLWDRLARFAEDYIRNGDQLQVEGRLEYGSFERNGITIPTAEIVAREVSLVGSPQRDAAGNAERRS